MPTFGRVLAALTAAVVIAGIAISPAQARKLSFASFLSAKHPVHQALDKYFERVTKDTNGSLTFETFPGGAMGGGKAALNIVRDGLVDSAFINPGYMPSNLPVGAMVGSMFAPTTFATTGAENELELFDCPGCTNELKKNGVKQLTYYATSTYSLMCAKPIKTTDDIKGLKVRTSGGYNFLATKLGAIPVNLTAGEMYEGLQRGQLDCVLGAPGFMLSYNLVDLVKTVIDMPLGVYHGISFYNMKQSVWDDLSKDEKTVMIKHLPELVAEVGTIYIKENEQARELAKKKGIEYIAPDDKMRAAFESFKKDEFKRILAKANKDGIKNAEATLTLFNEKIAKWSKMVNDETDPKEFAKMLDKEIFSKLKH